jgi:hypothetical protein
MDEVLAVIAVIQLYDKGQLISKEHFGFFNSPKK